MARSPASPRPRSRLTPAPAIRRDCRARPCHSRPARADSFLLPRIAVMTVDSSDSFASRHIGPRASDRAEMLATVKAPSLDALIDEVVPPSIRLDGPLPLPAAESEHHYLSRLRAHRGREPGLPLLSSGSATTTASRPRDPAERVREPRLVHALHAVSGRDRAGPPRVAAQLPDDGERPHRDGDRDRVAARRGHRGRRGDDDAPPRAGRSGRPRRTCSSSRTAAFRRRSTCCRRAPNRSASRCGSSTPTPPSSAPTRSALLLQYPDEAGSVTRPHGDHRAGARRPACWSRSRPTCWR